MRARVGWRRVDISWWAWLLGLIALPALILLGVALVTVGLVVAGMATLILSPIGILALVAWIAYRIGRAQAARDAVRLGG